MPVFTFKRLQCLVLVVLCNVPVFSNAGSLITTPAESDLQTPALRLGWLPGRNEPATWEVLAGQSGALENWHSLITTAENGSLISQHLRMSGTIHGETAHLNSPLNSGLLLQQRYEKAGHPYCFKVVISVQNNSTATFIPHPADNLAVNLGPGMGQSVNSPVSGSSSNYSFVEPVACIDGQVTSYGDGSTKTVSLDWRSPGLAWAGLHDRYFALIILPADPHKAGVSLPFTRTVVKFGAPGQGSAPPAIDLPMLSFYLPLTQLAPGQLTSWEFLVFSGPKSQAVLSSAPVNLDPLLFSGLWEWMRWICFGLMRLLSLIHLVIPDWGSSIILLALIVRMFLYPFAKKALISQQRFVEAQKQMLPEMAEIKKKWKGGEQSERILQLYKAHHVSPFAGLKPLLIVLIQLPILIALFQVLGATFELRDAGFLWIRTLAEPDRLFAFGFNIPLLGNYFNILPVLMAAVTLLSFRLSPAPAAEKKGQLTQNLFLIAMTLMFFMLFYSFPSGMVLYWTFANIFHIAQQKYMIYTAK